MRGLLFSAALTILAVVSWGAAPKSDPLYRRFPVKDLVKTRQEPVRTMAPAAGVVFADFGKAAFAQPGFEAELPAACTVTLRLGEALKDGRVDMKPGGSIRSCSYTLDLPAGRTNRMLELRPDPRNTRRDPTDSGTLPVLMPSEVGEVYPFRYCEIEGLPDGAAVSFFRDAVNYPFNDEAASFSCSDTALNRVWELCKYSIKATSFSGYYVDGDRERIPYEADALINQLSHYCTDSEYAVARRTAEFLLAHPTWPTEWHLQMVPMAWYDYLYTGDKALITKYYDLLKAKTLLSLRESNGLISTRTGKLTDEVARSLNYTGKSPIKDIVDWPRSGSFGIGKKEAGEADGYKLTDYNTAVNAWHYEALVLMARISDALGEKADAAYFRKQAGVVHDAVNTLLFDKEAGCYRDGPGTRHCSLHANMFPLAFGMVPAERLASVLEFIRSRGMACSVYGAQFLLDGLYDAGEDDYALSLMASTGLRSWYNMIRLGSTITLEAWDPCFKNNLDWNHAWGSAPANVVMRKLMGVEPLEPGFRKVRVRPRTGGLTQASALVPTARGGIRCSFELKPDCKTFEYSFPRGMKAEIWLPLPDADAVVFVNGRARRPERHGNHAVFNLGSGTWKFEIHG